jgi:hypothetical protein
LIDGIAGNRVARSRVIGFQFTGFAFEPIRQLARIGKDASAFSAGNAMHGQAAFRFPALYGALGAIEERRDLFPGDKRLRRVRLVGARGSHGQYQFRREG